MFVATKGYAPDAPVNGAGVCLGAVGCYPTARGLAAQRKWVGISNSLTTSCVGIASIKKPLGTRYIFAGTSTELFEYSAGAWSNVTRAAGNYSVGAGQRWSFAQYGEVTIAANIGDKIQSRSGTAGTVFANISDAPKAVLVESVGDFVFAFNTDDATSAGASFGRSPDRWWCSALGNYADWTPAIATQCASDTLVDTPGEIVAAKKLRETVVVYKERGIYVGRYVGPPNAWEFSLVTPDKGALSPNCVVNVNDVHYFMGNDDFYKFDGNTLTPIGAGKVRDAIYRGPAGLTTADLMNRSAIGTIYGIHDEARQVIVWAYPETSNAVPSRLINYSYISGEWAIYTNPTADAPVALFEWFSASAAPVLAVVGNTSRTIWKHDGSQTVGIIQTGLFGTEDGYTFVRRLRPRLLKFPASVGAFSNGTLYPYNSLGEAQSAPASGLSVPYARGAFDAMKAARWHSFTFSIPNGADGAEVLGLDVDMEADSYE